LTADSVDRTSAPEGTLGTFGGVFTPSILTILGLVLFLRVGYVVGSVGLVQALVILALATSVSVLTSISLATVATNMRVRGGGEYFLISRTLGIEFGGAVGVVLYLAISVSIAFYSIGFAEAAVAAFDSDSKVVAQLVAAAVVVLLAGIGIAGSDLATRLQYLVMVLLVLALVSFFVGAIMEFDSGLVGDNLRRPKSDVGFWEAFAVFFPAVTGFSQGVAMSGDLKSPSRSITRGTFAAVGLSTVVYAAALILLAGAAPAAVLAGETTTIMGDISILGWTMIVGVLAATLSSALASTLGGPRVLQRLGEDRVLPRLEFFANGAGPTNNPRRAVLLSSFIGLLTVAAGDLNAIAPVISMFFLASYGIINYATYFEIRAGSTAFRPRFRWYDRRASLAGTIACGGAIVAINPLAGALAALVFVALFNYLRHRDVPDRWIDSAGSHHYTQTRLHLRALADEPAGARDWRPCVLAFVPRDPTTRERMIRMSSWMEGGSGFLTAVRILEGSGLVLRRQAAEIEDDLGEEVDRLVPGTSARVLLMSDTDAGVQALVQSHGIGTIRANLTVFGVRDLRGTDDDQRLYSQMLQNCVRFGTNVAVTNVRDDAWGRLEATPLDERTIALWWSDDQAGQLITLLGWLCQRHPDWAKATITVFAPGDGGDEGVAERARIARVLDAARIRADVREVEPSPAALGEALGGATLAFAPLRVRHGTAMGPFGTPLGMLVESLPLAVMILAAETIDLVAEADDEQIAERIRVAEQVAAAQQRTSDLDGEAASLMVHAEAARLDLANYPDDDGEGRAALDQAAAAAESSASTAYRTYIDARARCVALEERLSEIAPMPSGADVGPEVWQSGTREPD
jgi:amino acid transporter